MHSRTPLFRAAWAIIALTLAALACTLQIGGEGAAGVTASPPLQRPSVEILQPAEGQTLAVGQTVSVQARATSPSGVTLVELLVNNVRVNSQRPAEALSPTVVEVVMDYTPDRPGTVVLAVQAYSGQVVGVPALRTITVLPSLSPGIGTPQTIPQATATIFNPVCRARVNVGGLRLRTGPGTEYDILRNFNAGDEPLIAGYADRSDGRWWQVSWLGTIGWTAAAYTSQLGDCSAVRPAVVPASPTPVPSVTPPPTQPGTTATPTLPDLFLTLLEGVSEIQLGASGTAQANFAMQVRNGGGQAAGPFRVAVLKPDGTVDYFNVPGLSPGQTVDVPAPGGFIVVFNTPGVARILVTVDDQNAVGESNEANNQAYRDVVVNPGPTTITPPPTAELPSTSGEVSAPLGAPAESVSPLVAEPETLPQAQPVAALGPISPANAGRVTEIAAMLGHGGTITGLDFNAAGTLLASSSRDGTARLWDVYLQSEVLILAGHNDRVQDVAFSPLGDQIASASLDGTVRLWDAASGTSLLALAHGAPVERTAFSPDGSRVASAGENPDAGGGLSGLTRVWDARTGAEIGSIQTFGLVTGVGFLSNSTLVIATAARDCSLGGGEVALYDIGSPEAALLTLAEGPTFDRLAVDAATGLIAASSQQDICAGNAVARVWTSGGALTAALDHGSNAVTGLAFNPGGTLLATTTIDGSVRLWDLGTSTQVAALSAGGTVETVAFSPDGTRLASGGAADAVLLWGVG